MALLWYGVVIGPSTAVLDAAPVISPENEAVDISNNGEDASNTAEAEANVIRRFLED